jgi:hypothetical protein
MGSGVEPAACGQEQRHRRGTGPPLASPPTDRSQRAGREPSEGTGRALGRASGCRILARRDRGRSTDGRRAHRCQGAVSEGRLRRPTGHDALGRRRGARAGARLRPRLRGARGAGGHRDESRVPEPRRREPELRPVGRLLGQRQGAARARHALEELRRLHARQHVLRRRPELRSLHATDGSQRRRAPPPREPRGRRRGHPLPAARRLRGRPVGGIRSPLRAARRAAGDQLGPEHLYPGRRQPDQRDRRGQGAYAGRRLRKGGAVPCGLRQGLRRDHSEPWYRDVLPVGVEQDIPRPHRRLLLAK